MREVDAVHIQAVNNGWIVKTWTKGKKGEKARVDVFDDWQDVKDFLQEVGILAVRCLGVTDRD